MATTPHTETIHLRRPRTRTLRRALRRAAWLTADLAGVGGCVLLFTHALT
jgi:hypothetical protein